MRSKEEEKQNVIDWLMHPSELGRRPKKIEFTKEFTDEDGIQCMIFKYKKSMFSPWLLAISSESGVFSEMQEYHPETEVEDAMQLLAFLKEYWKRMAGAQEEREERIKNAKAFHAFVLMKEPEWNPELFEKEFSQEWGIPLKGTDDDSRVEENADKQGDDGVKQDDAAVNLNEGAAIADEESGVDARIYTVGSMRLIMGYMDFPVPDGEAEYHAQFNYMWKEAVEVTKTHKAHMIVSVMGEGTPQEKGILFAKAVTTLCRQENTAGVYANNVVYEPRFYVAMAEIMEKGDFPIFNLVWFGLGRTEKGVSAYTCGLTSLGKDEIEILDSGQKPSEVREFLMNIVDYVVTEDVILHDGETIGESNEQRLKIVKSEGVNVEGESLKIMM